jgi:hypothetical protein
VSPGDRSRPPQGSGSETTTAPDVNEILKPDADVSSQRDASVTRVTPKTPAERAREYRKRKRDAVTDALVTPETVTPVTPDVTITPVVPATGMTKGDRDELAKITRQRGRVAKAQVEAVKAELLADIEAKLSAEFDSEDEMWREANKIADQAEREANDVIAQRCDELGIPEGFRPKRRTVWLPRGDNLDPSRRAELRKPANARLEHITKAAKLKIEAQEADVLTQLYAGGLTSHAAREFLNTMPDARSLMPKIELADLEAEAKNKSIGWR